MDLCFPSGVINHHLCSSSFCGSRPPSSATSLSVYSCSEPCKSVSRGVAVVDTNSETSNRLNALLLSSDHNGVTQCLPVIQSHAERRYEYSFGRLLQAIVQVRHIAVAPPGMPPVSIKMKQCLRQPQAGSTFSLIWVSSAIFGAVRRIVLLTFHLTTVQGSTLLLAAVVDERLICKEA